MNIFHEYKFLFIPVKQGGMNIYHIPICRICTVQIIFSFMSEQIIRYTRTQNAIWTTALLLKGLRLNQPDVYGGGVASVGSEINGATLPTFQVMFNSKSCSLQVILIFKSFKNPSHIILQVLVK